MNASRFRVQSSRSTTSIPQLFPSRLRQRTRCAVNDPPDPGAEKSTEATKPEIDYVYELGRSDLNMNIDTGQNSTHLDSVFTGNFLGHKSDIADGSLRTYEFRSFNNLVGDYYVAHRFMEKVAMHVAKNFLVDSFGTKRVAMLRFALFISVMLVSCQASSISLQLEHRLDSEHFEPAGTIEGTVAEEGTFEGPLSLIREPLSDDQVSKLKQLAKEDGQYSLRVRSSMTASTSDFVMASIPIRCLLSSNSEESLALELTDDNKIISMDYRSNCPEFTDQGSLETFGRKEVAVMLRYPGSAARLSMYEFIKKAESAGPVGGEGKPADKAQKQQKSWWQQNWLFVLAGALFMFQLIGTVADPNAAQQNQAAAQTRR